jgi:single-strand DNA-binding protein
MSSLNKVTLIGNVGQNPEIRNTGNGKPIVSFSLATTETWKDKQGQKQQKTEWHNIVIFNEGLCRVAEHYIEKGSKIFISGKLRTEKYTDKNGIEKYSTKIVLENFGGELILLSGKSDAAKEEQTHQDHYEDDLDGDVPF